MGFAVPAQLPRSSPTLPIIQEPVSGNANPCPNEAAAILDSISQESYPVLPTSSTLSHICDPVPQKRLIYVGAPDLLAWLRWWDKPCLPGHGCQTLPWSTPCEVPTTFPSPKILIPHSALTDVR